MSVGFSSVKAKDIGSGEIPALTSLGRQGGTLSNPVAGDLFINGVSVGASLAEDDNVSSTGNTGSAIAIAAAVNRVSAESGVYAKVNETVVLGSSMTAAAVNGTITINGYSTATVYTTTDAEVSRKAVEAAINDISGSTGVVAFNTGDDSRGVILTAKDGRNITLSAGGTLTAAATGLKSVTATTYSGTFSLYSTTGGPIAIDEQVGSNVQTTGLRQGVYQSGVAESTTFERTEATTAASTSTTGVLNSTTLVINDINISKAVATDDTASYTATTSTGSSKAASAIAIAAAVNKSSDLTGVTARADANIVRGNGTFTEITTATAGTVYINGVTISGIAGDRDSVIDSINQFTGQTGVRAEAWGAGLQLVADDGRNISISRDANATVANLGLGGQTIVADSAIGSTVFYSTVTLTSDKAFSVRRGSEGDGNFELLGFREGTFGGKDTGVKIAEIDVSTQLGAGVAITAIDHAIQDVASAQARSGAFQNRLDAAINILSESSENASAARSRILDTDYASETTALAKAQIVQQAATAMLAQANQQQQSVLALLQ